MYRAVISQISPQEVKQYFSIFTKNQHLIYYIINFFFVKLMLTKNKNISSYRHILYGKYIIILNKKKLEDINLLFL